MTEPRSEEELARALRALPAAPEGWSAAAKELPALRAGLDDLIARAEDDAAFRAEVLGSGGGGAAGGARAGAGRPCRAPGAPGGRARRRCRSRRPYSSQLTWLTMRTIWPSRRSHTVEPTTCFPSGYSQKTM